MSRQQPWEKKLAVVVAPADHPTSCSDKISLPHNLLPELDPYISGDGEPITLQLRARITGGPTCYGTVLDFTSEEGRAILPEWMINHLHLKGQGSPVIIQTHSQFEKAEFCQLVPKDPKFFHFKDYRAVLEAALGTKYTTLIKGSVINIDHQGTRFAIDVTDVQPNDVCSIINTDVEVDLQPPLGPDGNPMIIPESSEAGKKGLAKRGAMGDPINLKVDGPSITLQATQQPITAQVLVPANAGVCILAEAKDKTGDFEIYIGDEYEATIPNRANHVATCYDDDYNGKATVEIPISTQNKRYTVALSSFDESSGVDVSVQAVVHQADQEQEAQPMQGVVADADGDFDICDNCKERVPKGRLPLHQAYCLRHNMKCPICSKTIRKLDQHRHWHCDLCPPPTTFTANSEAAREKHKALFHSPITCSCGLKLEMHGLGKHKQSECPNRIIICRFCHNSMKAGEKSNDVADAIRGYTQHESVCGSKTVQCENCSKNIRLRDIELHTQVCTQARDKTSTEKAGSKTHQVIDANAVKALSEADRDRFWARSGFGGNSAESHISNYLPQAANTYGESTNQVNPTRSVPQGFYEPVKPTKVAPPEVCANRECWYPKGSNLLSTCSTCWNSVKCDSSDKQQVLTALIKKYYTQLTEGCASPLCRNESCRTAHPESGIAGNAAAVAAIKLAQKAFTEPRETQLCLETKSKEFSSSVDQLKVMGFPGQWCSLALRQTESKDAAVAWLLSNYES